MTAVQPPGRFGALRDRWTSAVTQLPGEAAPATAAWINGGFFVLEPDVLDYIDGDAHDLGARAAGAAGRRRRSSSAYQHDGFWQPMDTLRDKKQLEELWAVGRGAVEGLGMTRDFWRGRARAVTGHTGFKGGWLALWLHQLGADVHGYALDPPTEPSLLRDRPGSRDVLASDTRADIRDLARR